MSELFDAFASFLGLVGRPLGLIEDAYPGPFWGLLLLASFGLGIAGAVQHMRRKQISIGGTIVGSKGHTDPSGATMWRSATAVQRRPSLNPLDGRPVILRAFIPPALVVLAWLYVYAWPLLAAGILAVLGLAGYGLYRAISLRKHRRQLVYPMTAALARAFGQQEWQLTGVKVPLDYTETGAVVVLPLPDHWDDSHAAKAAQIVAARLGGEWAAEPSRRAPYTLTLIRKPEESQHVREVVRPIATALAPVLAQTPAEILRDVVLPERWDEPGATLRIPVPDGWRERQFAEVVEIVTERLGGRWDRALSERAPYVLTLIRRQPEPDYVVEVIRPMADALAVATGQSSDEILDAMAISHDWDNPECEILLPLPSHHRPHHINDVVAIVHERLGGDWAFLRSDTAPYQLTLWHQPPEPDYIVEIVKPMVAALAVAYGKTPAEILPTVEVPEEWKEETAQVVIGLPDEYRPEHVSQARRIVAERLGGDWASRVSDRKPFAVTFSHKPQPPTYVAVADVQDLILSSTETECALVGIGADNEPIITYHQKESPHTALSARTQQGKSTVNRGLVAQYWFQGGSQVMIDVKEDSFEGCDIFPDVEIYNDPRRLDLMWVAIHRVCREFEARRGKERGPKPWRPLYLHLEEQNLFSLYINRWWTRIRENPEKIEELCIANPVIAGILEDYLVSGKMPKICPVWDDITTLLLAAGGYNIHVISTYQKLTAAAAGGGADPGLGGALREMYGIKMLTGFNASTWGTVVDSKPIPPCPTRKGQWVLAVNGINRLFQAPNWSLEEMHPFLERGLAVRAQRAAELSPELSPGGGARSYVEITAPQEDKGTEDTTHPAGAAQTPSQSPVEAPLEGNVLPFRTRPAAPAEDKEMAPLSAPVTTDYGPEPKVHRYTLEEAVNEGVVPETYAWWHKERQRAKARAKNGQPHIPFPAGVKLGRAEKYTAEELRDWHAKRRAEGTGSV
ncbi:hypothetical protein [Nonomuraea ceibae]|uniref:hypothetical protein n=1 Tax=Nonomuraea ceibae TaxID=1935170 RepID=UPI001C5FA543|nr:hypothetical protein [Nonomuraea ceibae]